MNRLLQNLLPVLLFGAVATCTVLTAADDQLRYPPFVTSEAAKEAWRAGRPNWLGPGRSCAGIDTGLRLIDNIEDARLVWKSEERVPPVSLYGIRSGFASRWSPPVGSISTTPGRRV